MKKSYLIGAIASPLAGLLLWKLLLPQITGLNGVFIFMLGGFCLWTTLAFLLGLLACESSRGYRLAYAGLFLALTAVQLVKGLTDFPLYTLVSIFLLAAIYLVQQQEHRHQDE